MKVWWFSGHELWGLFQKLLAEARQTPGMMILIGCRAFDLEHDHRMRALSDAKAPLKRVDLKPLLGEQVDAVVGRSGNDPTTIDAKLREVLTLPLHLAMYLRLASEGRPNVRSRQALFDHFWEEAEQRVTLKLGKPPNWNRAIDRMVTWLTAQERWGKRDLERQIDGGLFEQTLLGKPKLSPALRGLHPLAETFFKDRYLVDFADLPEVHSERDLQKALLQHLKAFLLELGRDFCFIGSEYPVQVGGRDFAIDLLFFHRGLQALVAIELKIGAFEPEHMGKLAFYLEALDRDHRKPFEAPSIGVLLCKTRDADVVEYALSRTLSPALVAEYQTKLPDKHLLQAKLDEFFELVEREEEA